MRPHQCWMLVCPMGSRSVSPRTTWLQWCWPGPREVKWTRVRSRVCLVSKNWKESECLECQMVKPCLALSHMTPTPEPQAMWVIDSCLGWDPKIFTFIAWLEERGWSIQLLKLLTLGIFNDAWSNNLKVWQWHMIWLWGIMMEAWFSSCMVKIQWTPWSKSTLRNSIF